MNNRERLIFLRVQYSRQTGFATADNIPAYGDWLEKKLVSVLTEIAGEPVPDYGAWVELLQEKQKEQ